MNLDANADNSGPRGAKYWTKEGVIPTETGYAWTCPVCEQELTSLNAGGIFTMQGFHGERHDAEKLAKHDG